MQSKSNDDLGMEGAFFVVMGGFTIVTTGSDPVRLTLTPRGLVWLLQSGAISLGDLERHKNEISDKGKAGAVAKLLVCVEGLWLVAQCVFRSANDLPVTLLELHTVMHVICTVVIYTFWWNKPFDAGHPLELKIDAGGLAVVKSDYFSHVFDWEIHVSNSKPGPEVSDPPVLAPASNYPTMLDLPGITRHGAYPSLEEIRPLELDTPGPGILAFKGQYLLSQAGGFKLRCTSAAAYAADPAAEMERFARIADQMRACVATTPVQVGYENDAYEDDVRAIAHQVPPAPAVETPIQENEKEIPAPVADSCIQFNESEGVRTVADMFVLRSNSEDYGISLSEDTILCTEAMDFNVVGSLASSKSRSLWVLAFLCLLYGGAHGAAWSTHFPTDLERLLWRMSSVTAAILVPLMMPFVLAIDSRYENSWSAILSGWRERKFGDMVGFRYSGILYWVVQFGLLGVLFACYVAARAYLFAESFASSRSLAEGSYNTTVWEDFWPHL